jgi:hypothetical protein
MVEPSSPTKHPTTAAHCSLMSTCSCLAPWRKSLCTTELFGAPTPTETTRHRRRCREAGGGGPAHASPTSSGAALAASTTSPTSSGAALAASTTSPSSSSGLALKGWRRIQLQKVWSLHTVRRNGIRVTVPRGEPGPLAHFPLRRTNPSATFKNVNLEARSKGLRRASAPLLLLAPSAPPDAARHAAAGLVPLPRTRPMTLSPARAPFTPSRRCVHWGAATFAPWHEDRQGAPGLVWTLRDPHKVSTPPARAATVPPTHGGYTIVARRSPLHSTACPFLSSSRQQDSQTHVAR